MLVISLYNVCFSVAVCVYQFWRDTTYQYVSNLGKDGYAFVKKVSEYIWVAYFQSEWYILHSVEHVV